MSQTELSKISGISQPFIANIEAGRRGVTPQIATAIENALSIPALALVSMGYVKQLLSQKDTTE